ncbi:MAG: T9SS type A sorting domain-containing protein [Bacteroidales bacterium]|nr:T9SS type A sorting domain-containing protein [Bacteroidales bacterium]
MKKVSLLIAMMVFSCLNTFAQFSFDFTGCPEGAKVAQTLGMPWSTWSENPGSSEDGVFGAVDGDMAAYFTYGVDQILAFGDKTTGVYDIEFDIYIEENYLGYFNICHHFPNPASSQAIQVYLQCTNDGSSGSTTMSNGHGTVHAGSNSSFDLPCRWNDWMHFRIHVDLDMDVAEFYFDDEFMYTWQWSLNSFGEEGYSDRTLGGVDFFPPNNANDSRFYVDNVVFTPQGGEQELIGDSFEEYTVGNKIAAEAVAAGHDWWTTWSNNPGGANDGTVSNDYASEGNNSGYFTNASDQVLLLGDYETGVYDLSFDVYTPAGKDGYFNILHAFPASGNGDWAMQAYFNAESDETNNEMWHSAGHGSVHAGGALVADLPCVEDQWMNVRVHIDCDSDQATLFFNDEEIYTWQWSLGSFGDPSTRVLAGANFYGPLATSQFYVDNVHFNKIGGESAPHFVFDTEEINIELMEDDMTTEEIVIENQGNSIGDWMGWLDFGQGQGGSSTQDLYYDNEPDMNTGANVGLVGLNVEEPTAIEVGARFPGSSYAGAAMGTKVIGAKYTFFEGQDSGTGLEPNTDVIFRIYGQGVNGQPGEVLAEKILPYNQVIPNDWNTVTFDTPVDITGFDVWVTCEFTQAVGGYPFNFDEGSASGEGDYYRAGNGAFRKCHEVFSSDYGNFHIRMTCQGEPIMATWAILDKNYGTIMGGNSETITLTLNSIGLDLDSSHTATLVINTNDANVPHVEIPVNLFVWDNVEESINQLASIYPNPAASQVTLEGENLNSVAIYNVAGQLVRVVKLDNMVNNINMDVEAGVYFFSIYDNNGNNSVQRVVITK